MCIRDRFSNELNNLGVRVNRLEDRVGNVKVNGDVRLRYLGTKAMGPDFIRTQGEYKMCIRDSVIGVGSVITKDVEPYTVVVGSNRVIKQRFSDSIVESLLSMKWWKWDDDKIFESMKYWSKIEEFIARYK